MPDAPEPLILPYGRAPLVGRWRRLLLLFVLLGATVGGGVWLAHQIDLWLYGRRVDAWYARMLAASPAPGTLIYSELPADLDAARRSGAMHVQGSRPVGAPPESTLWSCVAPAPPGSEGIYFHGTDARRALTDINPQPVFFQSARDNARHLPRLLTVASVFRDPLTHAPALDVHTLVHTPSQRDDFNSRLTPITGWPDPTPGTTRLFQAWPDPTDPSKFYIPAETDGQRFWIEGTFTYNPPYLFNDYVTLTVRSTPPPGANPTAGFGPLPPATTTTPSVRP